MNEQLLSFLSLTKRAGRLALGFDVVKEAVLTRRAYVVLCASDLSKRTQKEIALLCKKAQVPRYEIPTTMDEIWFLVGKRSGILAILDRGMAEKTIQMLLASSDATPTCETTAFGKEVTPSDHKI